MDSPTAPVSGGPMFGQVGVKAYRFRQLLRRHWWILTLTISLAIAWQGWQVYQLPQLFQSEAQVYIREELAGGADKTQYNAPPEPFTATTIAMMKGAQTLEAADQKMALQFPDLKGERPEIEPKLLPRSYIFIVVGRGKNALYTQRYVDAVVDAFIEFRVRERDRNQTQYGQNVEVKIRELEKKRDDQRAEVEQFTRANNMPFWKDQASQGAKFLSDLKMRQATLQTMLQKLRNMTPDQLLNAPSAPATPGQQGGAAETNASPMENNSLYTVYLTRMQDLAQLQSRLQERSTIWKPKHPRLQALKDQVAEVERSIKVLKTQQAEIAEGRVDAINAELKGLEGSIAEWEKSVLQASDKDNQLRTLSGRVEKTEEELRKTQDIIMSIAGANVKNDIFTRYTYAPPSTAVSRGLVKKLIIGLVGGLALGLAILAFLDRVDDRLTSSSEMMEQFSEPILGQIPDVMASRGEAGLPLLQVDDERYTFAEAFRSLRSSLIFMPNQSELRTLLVTSAIPNEGKSTITANLAITMAASGANIVVVDADLRRGDLASLFDTDGRTGLSNILRGEVPWSAATQATKYPTLTLIPRGPVTNQSSELLLLPSVDKLLEELKAHFDLVIFNTAPILAADDTPTLAPHFDGSLMVIRAQFTSARLTQNALASLYQRQVNVLGMILNCVDTEMPDYYYYRYPKYYATK